MLGYGKEWSGMLGLEMSGDGRVGYMWNMYKIVWCGTCGAS